MPLSDWLGGSRQDGFAYQLQLAASRLGLAGEIVDGVGYFQIWGRSAMHPLIISLDHGVLVRILSNVRFPPGRVPQRAVAMLMEWHDANRDYAWDVHNNPKWCCFYIKTIINLSSFGTAFLQRVLEEALAEIGALENVLINGDHPSNTLPVSAVPIQFRPALPHVAPALLSPNEVPDYVTQLARHLLEGPR